MANQQKIKTPSITIDGKTYKAQKKASLIRKMYKLRESEADTDTLEGMDEMLQFIADCFNDENVTIETVEDNLDMDEFFGLFQELAVWVKSVMENKMGALPNDQGTSRQ